jgi:predicted amidophosphoribosyltransferase
LSTLTRRTSIRTKTKLSYATLRTWTKLIKDHQISALKIVKQDADQAFVDGVALEIVDHFRNMFGIPAFTGVVPVPCGHSGTNNCLSVRISKSVSELMSVPFLDILEHTARPGKSHPSKNAKLVAPKLLVNERLGPVLLVDDVATSGRHIELAVQSLRAITDQVSAVAWIGAN